MTTSSTPLALVNGKALAELPSSLYVPPAALRLLLESFEGPMDLLHYLIKRDSMDILDIPMAELTRQYLEYVDQIVTTQMELVADYLLMAATLIEIKSRMLLPQMEPEEEETEDPRAELVKRLLIYTKIRGAAEAIRNRSIQGRDFWWAAIAKPPATRICPRVSARMLQLAILGIKDRRKLAMGLEIASDNFTMREAMANMILKLKSARQWLFTHLVGPSNAQRTRLGTFFLAALQLAKEQLVRLEQKQGEELHITVRHDRKS